MIIKFLKKYKFINTINAVYKCILTKLIYSYYSYKYESNNILIAKKWEYEYKKDLNKLKKTVRKKVYFVSTSYEQDIVGIIPALKEISDLVIFQAPNGNKNIDFPNGKNNNIIRKINSVNILEHFERSSKNIDFDIFILQGWAYLIDVDVLKIIRSKKIKVINISMDDRHSFHKKSPVGNIKDQGVFGLLDGVDLFLTAAPEIVKWYQYYGKRAIFCPEASYPNENHEKVIGSFEKDIDVLFIGENYGKREVILNSIKNSNAKKIVCYGKGWPNGRIASTELDRIYARSKIILGIGGILHCNNFPALKMRDFDIMMSGNFYLPQYNPDLNIVFPNINDLMWNNIDDLIRKINYFLENDDIRDNMAEYYKKYTQLNHNWKDRFLVAFGELDYD